MSLYTALVQATGFEITPGMWLGAALGILLAGMGTLLRINITLYKHSGRTVHAVFGDEKTPGLVKDVADMGKHQDTMSRDMALMAKDIVTMDKRHEEMAKNLGAILRGEAPFIPRQKRQHP